MFVGVVKHDEFPYWDRLIKSGTMYKPNYIWGSPILSQRDDTFNRSGAADSTTTQQNQNNDCRQTIPSQRIFPWAQVAQSESESESRYIVQNENVNTSQSQLSHSRFVWALLGREECC